MSKDTYEKLLYVVLSVWWIWFLCFVLLNMKRGEWNVNFVSFGWFNFGIWWRLMSFPHRPGSMALERTRMLGGGENGLEVVNVHGKLLWFFWHPRHWIKSFQTWGGGGVMAWKKRRGQHWTCIFWSALNKIFCLCSGVEGALCPWPQTWPWSFCRHLLDYLFEMRLPFLAR